MSLLNISLKLWSLNMAYPLIFLLKNVSSFCICKSYSHFFSKNTCELDSVLIRTVKILTTNELVKLMMLWTTGPWTSAFLIKIEFLIKSRILTRGPWWSYIAHLSKQLCILTVEVSAKFTALRFLYIFYSPAPQRPCFFHASWWLELNTERGSLMEQFCRYIEIGPVVSDKKIFKMSYIDI